MKFCAIVCEFDPFHNGHASLLRRAREESGCDKVLCIMSGNFTQRGGIAGLPKQTRARHAVENGADVVLELPALYAVAPAELFARGAIHILSALPAVTTLAFGAESGTTEDFLTAGRALSSEEKAFKNLLKEKMKGGESYIRARNAAALECHPELKEELFTLPNNILGTEYCRALVGEKSTISPIAIQRTGSGHDDLTLQKGMSSSSAIRAALSRGDKKSLKLVKGCVPSGVWKDLPLWKTTSFEEAAVCALLRTPPEQIAKTADCSEGLENRLLTMAHSNPMYSDIVSKVTTKRYTLARIRRILAQNFLGLNGELARQGLESPLYARVLAVKKDDAADIFSALGNVLARKSDYLSLKKTAHDVFDCDLRADYLYAALTGISANEYLTLFVE